MSNNDLYCSKCKSYHHPADCPLDSATNPIKEKCLEAAAQLWCLPENEHKGMDVELCKSIASALEEKEILIMNLTKELYETRKQMERR